LKEIQTHAQLELIPGPTTERTTESRTWDQSISAGKTAEAPA